VRCNFIFATQIKIELMNKKVVLPIILALCIIIGVIIGLQINKNARFNRPFLFSNHPDKYQSILNFISANYVDTVDVNKISENGYQHLMQQLDPHCTYISASEYTSVNEPLQGNFKGVGIEFYIVNDTVMVMNVIKGGPSEKAGVKDGDKIVAIDDTLMAGKKITSEKIFKKLRGKSDTKVKVTVLRNGKKIDLVINRGEVKINSVDAAYMVDKQTGYIKINTFGANTYVDFMENIDRMINKEGMKKLVIDLRQNGGGYLDAATNILDELLSDSKTIVYTENRNHTRHDYNCSKDGMFEDGKICLLVDEGSASASEIFAGALQDWDRATIIGRRTFGKGLVQQEYMLNDSSAIRITVARYYTPSGRCIQKSYKNGQDDYEMDIYKRYKHGEFQHADSIKFADTTKYYTAKGKIVYGGGGIKPDVFIPADTQGVNQFSNECFSKSLVQQFAYQYTSNHANELDKYKSATDFSQHFVMDKNLFESFINYAKKNGVKSAQPNLINGSAIYLQNEIKAFIAKAKWKMEGYYTITHLQDKVFQKAISVLK
jgi:carboxyl-terminal processing protease